MQILNGGPNGNRPRPFDLAEPILGADPPEHMSEIGRQVWAETMPRLAAVRLITDLDLIGLEMLCEAYADWCAAVEALQEAGSRYYTIRDQLGNNRIIPHPALAQIESADRRIRAWLTEFGMTPSARARWGRGAEPPPVAPQEVDLEKVDLKSLNADERAALREMLERRAMDRSERS